MNIAEGWQSLGRRLGIDEARLTGFDKGNKEYSEKPYKMLLHWMNREGSSATYKLSVSYTHLTLPTSDLV